DKRDGRVGERVKDLEPRRGRTFPDQVAKLVDGANAAALPRNRFAHDTFLAESLRQDPLRRACRAAVLRAYRGSSNSSTMIVRKRVAPVLIAVSVTPPRRCITVPGGVTSCSIRGKCPSLTGL